MKFDLLMNTPIFKAFSEMGKNIFQPNGIFYWAGRAKKEADVNATIGTAVGPETDLIADGRDLKVPYYLPEIKDYITLNPEQYVPYAPIAGLPALREAWTNWVIFKAKQKKNSPSGSIDLTGKLSLPTICNGITNAIFLMSRLFLDINETIVSPNKRWGNYNSILSKQNGICRQNDSE